MKDSTIDKLILVGGPIVIVAGVAVWVALVVYSEHWLETAPCSEFASWRVQDVPLRCLPEAPR